MTEVNGQDTVLCGGLQSDRIATQCLGDTKGPTMVAHAAAVLDLTHEGTGFVFNRRQCFGVGAGTGLVAAGRHGQAQRLMGALQVVDIAPVVEA